MAKPTASLVWLENIELKPEQGLRTEASIVKTLRKQLIAALQEQNYTPADLSRCVYVIRMKGDFVIAYPWQRSPVLYIGRGAAFGRLSSHLRRWLHEVEGFGKDVRIEIRVCRPRRRNFADMFKYVEADLISRFAERYGAIPFFNSRRETSYERYVEYTDSDEALLTAALGIGNGKRPLWAIAPAPANKNYEVFHRGRQQ
ncbi:hypothetical protein [Mesorhizobium sp. L-8-3]|uniref:hypothetical protein n=1 Tax=Mesorhizobium sp. L-8-3 TaxID=2744522 RepID=UPI001927D8ED|nr:hypothetical protein [Mesorhizobium sp. L-8-3]BCH27295.1 hypothetical protein MesoLjLb_70800 [Mesorhizobium sp. L-8-3]